MSIRRRVSRLGWFFLLIAFITASSSFGLPPARSEAPGIIAFLAIIVPAFIVLNWLGLRYGNREHPDARMGGGRPGGVT